jgi:hypothetical protein
MIRIDLRSTIIAIALLQSLVANFLYHGQGPYP